MQRTHSQLCADGLELHPICELLDGTVQRRQTDAQCSQGNLLPLGAKPALCVALDRGKPIAPGLDEPRECSVKVGDAFGQSPACFALNDLLYSLRIGHPASDHLPGNTYGVRDALQLLPVAVDVPPMRPKPGSISLHTCQHNRPQTSALNQGLQYIELLANRRLHIGQQVVSQLLRIHIPGLRYTAHELLLKP